jgi:glycosyltransferase involved in cell wall biosynthesis
VDDIRWFAANRYATLVAEELRRCGVAVALDGSRTARLAFAMSGTTGEIAWRYAQRVGCPLILYIWDLPPQATGSGSYDPIWSLRGRLIRIPKWRGGFARRRGFYSRLRYIASRAQEVWAPSTLTADLIHQRFGVVARRVPYCYDSARFGPGALKRESPPVLLTVGRLKAHKNQVATIRAASRIGRPVQVRLIGRGPEASALQATARSLGVACRIDTEADDAAVVDAYQRAQVAICPSRFEGFGLGPIESLACGTPVVASDIPPHREFAGHAARLFPLDDEDALVTSVKAALLDPAPNETAVRSLTISAAADRFLAGLSPLIR